MEFEWDEAKRLSNLQKHGFDFLRAARLFSTKLLITEAREHAGEPRWFATGLMDGTYVTAVFTYRHKNIRIISIRRARSYEQARHKTLYGG